MSNYNRLGMCRVTRGHEYVRLQEIRNMLSYKSLGTLQAIRS
jgi:hypothetical protein